MPEPRDNRPNKRTDRSRSPAASVPPIRNDGSQARRIPKDPRGSHSVDASRRSAARFADNAKKTGNTGREPDTKQKRSESGRSDRRKPAPLQTMQVPPRPTGNPRSEKIREVQTSSTKPVTDSAAGSSAKHMGHIRSVNRKKALYRAFFLWVAVLLFMVVAAAATLYVTDYVAPKPKYAFVTRGTIEHSIGASALILRDETAYLSNTEGDLVTLTLEGSRVSKGQNVAMVIPEAAKDTAESLNQVQKQIVDRQRELLASGKGAGAQALYDEADNGIIPIVDMIRLDSISGTLSNLVSYTSSVQVLMDSRGYALQTVDFQDEQLNTLIAQKQALESALSTGAAMFVADIPGIVSYKLDGLETTLSSASVADLTPEQLEKYIAASNGSMLSSLHVKANTNAFRICKNADQYFATVVEGFSITDFPLNTTVDIRVTAEGIVIPDCTITRSIQSAHGVFIVLHTTGAVERLLDKRTVEIELIRKSTSGLRVPVASLIAPDYTTGYAQMMYNASGYARLMTVKIVDHDREYAIVEPAEGFDIPNDSTIIITNPETLSEGDKVEQ